MGRPYAQELRELPDTYRDALSTEIGGLEGFVSESLASPLRAVGSGGSATACVFASVLHERSTGLVARHATPLEQLYASPSPGTSILLVSAGGSNRDITAALGHAAGLGRKSLGVLCSSGGAGRLAGMCAGRRDVWLHDAAIPHGDGYLATNSLLASCVWLARAYGRRVPGWGLPGDALRGGFARFLHTGGAGAAGTVDGFRTYLRGQMEGMADSSTVVVLHDAFGRPAAVDLESKLVEAGACNVQVADYRNFAHGRHNWLDKHGGDTGVVMLSNCECDLVANRTAKLLPGGVPVAALRTDLRGAAGMLSLLVQSMCAAGVLSEQRGIDPGRPRVAGFGRKLYAMGPYA